MTGPAGERLEPVERPGLSTMKPGTVIRCEVADIPGADARARPEKYRDDVEPGDRVLVVDLVASPGAATTSFETVGCVGVASDVQTRDGLSVAFGMSGRWSVASAWLRVGGVEQGPRPEVGGRVIVLAWAGGGTDMAVCTVIGGAERDDVHPKSIQVREDGTGRPENLRAFCQGCHLHYDREHHADTRRERRAAELAGQMDTLIP